MPSVFRTCKNGLYSCCNCIWEPLWRFLVTSFGPRFNYEHAPEWTRVNAECQSLDLREGNDYRPALEHASRYYDEVVQIRNKIDTKAEWLFGIAMASSAGVVVLATQQGEGVHPLSRVVWFPCLVLLAYAMLTSARAKLPAARALPVPGIDLIEWINNAPEQVPGWMSSSLHVASTGILLTNQWKCELVNYATVAMTIAVVWFGLSLAIFAGS